MSNEHPMVFIDKMNSDDTFRDEVVRIDDEEAKIEYVNREGLNFSSDELKYAVFATLIKD